MWNYTDKVMDHFLNPRNVGEVENPDGVGEVGNAACGDAPTVGGSVPQTALSTSAQHGGLVAENFAALPVGYFYPSGLRCPVFAAGDGAPLQKADRCPCSASPVSAAGSGSAAQPPAHRGNPGPAGPPLDRGSKPVTAPSNCRLLAAAKLWA